MAESRPNTALEPLTSGVEGSTGVLAESGSFGYLRLRVVQYGLLFTATILVTRQLGPAGRAAYALPLALAGAAWVLTHLTLEVAASRLLARKEFPLNRLLGAMSLTWFALSLLGMLVAVCIGLWQREDLLAGASPPMVICAALTIPCLLASQMAGQILVLLGNLRNQAMAGVWAGLVQLALVVALIAASALTPATALVAALVGFAIYGGLLVIALARMDVVETIRPKIDRHPLLVLIKTGVKYHPASVAVQFAPRLDLILVGALVSAHGAGLYSLALVLADAALLAAQALTISAMPRQFGDSEDAAARFTLAFVRQGLLLTTAIILVAAPLAYPFITIVYGSDFSGATLPFLILLTGMAATAIEAPCRVLLIRLSRPSLVSGLVCLSVAMNVALTIALISAWGVTGAAVASAAAFWALASTVLYFVVKKNGASLRDVFSRPSRNDEVVRLLRSGLAKLRLASGSS